jgi:hypothetical protein
VGLECGLEELDALVVSDKHESAANAAKNVREVALKKRSIIMVLAKRMPKHMTFPTPSTKKISIFHPRSGTQDSPGGTRAFYLLTIVQKLFMPGNPIN